MMHRTLPRFLSRAALPLFLASVLPQLLPAQNPPAAPEERRRRGDGGDRGNFNPQEMQARLLTALRERLDVKDDEEWKVISERVAKVAELRRAAPGAGMPMMAMMGGRGGPGRPGGEERGPGAGDRGGPGRGGPRGGGTPEMTALSTALRDQLPDAEIKSRLERLRDQRREAEAKVARAQDELRAVLTVRQEAVAVMFGLLP